MPRSRPYFVRFGGKDHIIEAGSQEQAIGHLTKPLVEEVHAAKASEVAAFARNGGEIAVAGVYPEPKLDTSVYALETEVKVGSILIADGGFTCIEEGARLEVTANDKGELVVPCADGEHCIDGQLDDGDRYIGFRLADPLPPPESHEGDFQVDNPDDVVSGARAESDPAVDRVLGGEVEAAKPARGRRKAADAGQ